MIAEPVGCFTLAAAKDPLTLSLSPRGERTLELSAADILGVLSPLGEKDRMRGSCAEAISRTWHTASGAGY